MAPISAPLYITNLKNGETVHQVRKYAIMFVFLINTYLALPSHHWEMCSDSY